MSAPSRVHQFSWLFTLFPYVLRLLHLVHPIHNRFSNLFRLVIKSTVSRIVFTMPAFRFAHCSYSDATRRLPTHSRFHHSHHLNSRPLSLRFDLVCGLVIRSTVFHIMFIMPVFALVLTQPTFPQTNLFRFDLTSLAWLYSSSLHRLVMS